MNQVEKMEKFLQWLVNKVKTVHQIENEEFINIMQKLD